MLRKLLWLPGYLIIAWMYFLPKESGKARNVVTGSRWWLYKDSVAPVVSVVLYVLFAILIGVFYNRQSDTAKETSINSIAEEQKNSSDNNQDKSELKLSDFANDVNVDKLTIEPINNGDDSLIEHQESVGVENQPNIDSENQQDAIKKAQALLSR